MEANILSLKVKLQLREVPENPKLGRKLTRMLGTLWLSGSFLNEDFEAARDSGKGVHLQLCPLLPPRADR